MDELLLELGNEAEYPLPEEKGEGEREQITYKDVDVTITLKKGSEKDAETDEEKRKTMFTDSGFELGEMEYDEAREILRVPIILAKEMVYHYDGYDAFRPREELEAIEPYIKGIPVTRGHPEAKLVTDRTEVLGWATEGEYEEDELRVILEIADKALIADIQSGKLRDVSPGHFSRLDEAATGEFEGVHYDATQRDIFIDHIAIVPAGRCSTADGCGIVVDAKEEVKSKKKKEGDENMEVSKAVVEKVELIAKIAESIVKKADAGKAVLEEVKGLKEVPAPVIAKVEKAIKIVESIEGEAKKEGEKLEEISEALESKEETGYPKPGEKKGEGDAEMEKKTKMLDEKVKLVEKERDALKLELDAIIEVEKTKLVDELSTLQDVKTEDQLKEMSLDSLKSDLELVKAIRGSKIAFDDKGRDSGGIAEAYKGIGKKGGKK